jgi:hypothetical protein
VSWLYGETWLWYLIAFLVGLLLAWLAFVRPQQRRLKALLLRSPAPAQAGAVPGGGAGSAGLGDDTAETTRLAPPVSDAETIETAHAPAPEEPTESIPAERAADDVEDAPTDVFPAVDPALSTLDTATLAVADAETPPSGIRAVPAPTADQPTADQPTADQPTADAPPADRAADRGVADQPVGDQQAGDQQPRDEPESDGPAADQTSAGHVAGDEPADDAPTTARLRRQEPPAAQPPDGDRR